MRYLLNIATVCLVVFGVSCSKTPLFPLVTQHTDVPRTESIVVMGIKWVEVYKNTRLWEEEGIVEYITLKSGDLLRKRDSIKSRGERVWRSKLPHPLYYLSNFRLIFVNNEEKERALVRFNDNPREYEDIAIHRFTPGGYALQAIRYTSKQMNEKMGLRWYMVKNEVDEEFGRWNIQAGKIVYLGEITLHFFTHRYLFGQFPREDLVKKMTLETVVIQDRFEETKARLKETRPWLPVDEMVNLSSNRRWEYKTVKRESVTREKPEDDSTADGKRDKSTSFF